MNIITKSLVYGAILSFTIVGALIGFTEILIWMKAVLPRWVIGWILGATFGTIAFSFIFYGYFQEEETERMRKESTRAIV